jgi:hypothetical protein
MICGISDLYFARGNFVHCFSLSLRPSPSLLRASQPFAKTIAVRPSVIATARYEAGSKPCAYTGLLHCVRNDGEMRFLESLVIFEWRRKRVSRKAVFRHCDCEVQSRKQSLRVHWIASLRSQ